MISHEKDPPYSSTIWLWQWTETIHTKVKHWRSEAQNQGSTPSLGQIILCATAVFQLSGNKITQRRCCFHKEAVTSSRAEQKHVFNCSHHKL